MKKRVGTTIACMGIASGLGCDGTARTEGPCPDTLRDEIVFTPPEISGSIDGIEIPTQDLSRRPEERCNATVELRDWRNCFEDTPPPRDMYVELECFRNNQRFLTASIRIGDIRDTPVGSADVYAQLWNSMGAEGKFRMTIEAATGGADAYPKLVTPDFSRSVRLELDFATFAGELRFDLQATAFEGRPQQVCSSWGC